MGEPAPIFMAKTHDGRDFYLRDYCGQPRGQRNRQERNILVLSFFASWCKPCKAEMPMLQELASKYREDGILFYLVNKGESQDTVSNFLFEQVVNLPVLMDQYEVLAKKFQVRELPTLAVITKEGILAECHTGYAEGYQSILAGKLDSLLGKVPPKAKGSDPDSLAKPKARQPKGKTIKRKSNQ